MMSVSVIIEASASGIITQPAAATMPRSVVSWLTWVTASLPEVWAGNGAMAASRQPVVRRNRFMFVTSFDAKETLQVQAKSARRGSLRSGNPIERFVILRQAQDDRSLFVSFRHAIILARDP